MSAPDLLGVAKGLGEPLPGFFESRRLKLHFVDWGRDDGPPLVLVHGGLDHCRSWDWTAQELRSTYRVFAVDLAGHGDSDHAVGSNYDLTDFVCDLHAFLQRQGVARTTLIGHSLGGAVCSLFAGAFPDRVEKLVLVEGLRPAITPKTPPEERISDWVARVRRHACRTPRAYLSLEAAERRLRETNPRLSSDQVRHLTWFGLKRGADGLWRWKYDNYIRLRSPVRFSNEEVADLWSRIDCPTLLVGGGQSGRPDPSANGWLSHFSNGQSVMFPDAGHWLHHERFDDFIAVLRSFLD